MGGMDAVGWVVVCGCVGEYLGYLSRTRVGSVSLRYLPRAPWK